jgi:ABC-type spermidine/putrescine transport system permease subunit II
LLGSIGNSFVIAVLTTVLCVVAGTLCAVGCWRLSTRLSEGVRTLMLLPIVIPSIVYSLGIYRLFVDLDLLDTIPGVVLAHHRHRHSLRGDHGLGQASPTSTPGSSRRPAAWARP